MIRCSRCGVETPRLRLDQRYCPECERAVAEIIRSDDERRSRRVWKPKVWSPRWT